MSSVPERSKGRGDVISRGQDVKGYPQSFDSHTRSSKRVTEKARMGDVQDTAKYSHFCCLLLLLTSGGGKTGSQAIGNFVWGN